MEFKLSRTQEEKLNKWKEHIKALYGQYGTFTYSFTPNGIGCGVEVYSQLAKVKIDLTEVEHF